MAHITEAELDALMDRLSDGDRSAFQPLYEALRPRAVRFARSRLDEAQTEDAAQATLLRVFSRAAEFERGRPVLPWFYAIAANEIRALARKKSLAIEDDRIPTMDPEAELCAREIARALERAIADLDDDSAQAILAVLERGPRPCAPSATFRKRVSRAYARLRIILGGALVLFF
ncbi:MAG TPA: RNA polymerase sigma factor [Polyangiaceae bacterium]|jgi:RNA polymerase sigma factor (sigma-70 family)